MLALAAPILVQADAPVAPTGQGPVPLVTVATDEKVGEPLAGVPAVHAVNQGGLLVACPHSSQIGASSGAGA